MFVSKAKHQAKIAALEHELFMEKVQFAALLSKWNSLVKKLNAKGGETFINHATVQQSSPLTKEDINRLLMLVHPDRHGGKESAKEMTAKLLDLRKTFE